MSVNLYAVREMPGEKSGTIYHSAKRVIDIAFSLAALIFVAPLILFAALALKYFSPGPAFYTSERIGLNGRPFRMFKLRTMCVDAEARLAACLAADPQLAREWATTHKLKKDPRVIPVIGAFLRKSSIDELPQFLNVLRGDMSLVGPRPFPDYHCQKFDSEFRALRASVKPGLTGLWQISCRSDSDFEQQKAADETYIRNRCLLTDMKIVLMTVPAVLLGKSAY